MGMPQTAEHWTAAMVRALPLQRQILESGTVRWQKNAERQVHAMRRDELLNHADRGRPHVTTKNTVPQLAVFI